MKLSKDSESQIDLSLNARKVVERALLLPLIGLLLLVPPIAGIFEIDYRLFGIPFTILYLFGVWATLIILAIRLSHRLQSVDEREAEREQASKHERASQQ